MLLTCRLIPQDFKSCSQSLSPSGAHIITGGLGSLGILTAFFISQDNPRSPDLHSSSEDVYLLGRSGRVEDENLQSLQNSKGMSSMCRCDVSSVEETKYLVEKAREVYLHGFYSLFYISYDSYGGNSFFSTKQCQAISFLA